MPVNLRTLYDNGVDVSYATDATFDARAALAHELKGLNLVFSIPDLIKIMGPRIGEVPGPRKRHRHHRARQIGRSGDPGRQSL